MRPFSFIYVDDKRTTCFDRYFVELNRIRSMLPQGLADFATCEARYTLDGEKTLHDAKIIGFDLQSTVSPEQVWERNLTLRLLQALGREEIRLSYSGVFDVQLCFQPDEWPHRPVDLLVHEVSVIRPGVFRHLLEFDRGVFVDVEFSAFATDTVPIS